MEVVSEVQLKLNRFEKVNMTKVLYVDSGLTGGGATESIYQLINAMDRKHFQPLLAFVNSSRHIYRFKNIGVHCFQIPDLLYHKKFHRRFPKLAKFLNRIAILPSIYLPPISPATEILLHGPAVYALCRIILANRVDLVHVNNQPNRDLYAIAAASYTGIPCISHMRSFYTFGFNPTKAAYANRRVSTFVAYSHQIAETWGDAGVDNSKVEIIYNAIGDIHPESIDIHQIFNIPANRKLIGIVGNIIPERGHAFLIDAFGQLLSQDVNAHLLIVGDGPDAIVNKLKKISNQAGLNERISFCGDYPQAVNLINALDLLVLPYTIEPFGRVLLEAWATETPVVLSNVGRISAIAGHEKTALIANYGDAVIWAECMRRMIEDTKLRRRITASARVECASRFHISSHWKGIRRIYNDLLDKEKKTALN